MNKLTNKINAQFQRMCKTNKLFRSEINGDEIWELYLKSFDRVDDPVFRDPKSSLNNCNLCKNFIRRYGNIITINENGEMETIFSNLDDVEEYTKSVIACDNLLKKHKIKNVFFETYDELNSLPYEKCNKSQSEFLLGVPQNYKTYSELESLEYGGVVAGEVYTFNHFYLKLPTQFVDKTGKSISAIEGVYRDKYSVFKRTMEEISLDSLILVKDLINQGSLLDGTTHLPLLNKIIEYKTEFNEIKWNTDFWLWVITYDMGDTVAKFRNHLIGTTCVEISEGKDINKVCKDFNIRIDPINYHKAKSPITKQQIELAQKFVEENGYVESFNRRLATLEDVKASEILHINRDNNIKPVSIFDSIKTPSGKGRHKRSEFDKVESVHIDKFMKDILPNCTSIEVLLENRMESNLVNLTTSAENSKQIFKWNNPFSYTFNGNLAGKSLIKSAVKSRGGNTEGCLNVRLHFPETTNDYDLHMYEPNGNHIYYGNVRIKHNSSGMLDLDAQGVDGHQQPDKRVENIVYTDINKMPDGIYKVSVNNYSGNKFPANFNIEIEFNDEITSICFDKHKKYNSSSVDVCRITKKNNEFTLDVSSDMSVVSSHTQNKEIWGLETNEFHKVNLVCLTPNHWDEEGIGNKYYLFMLQGCKNPNHVRGFHNEHLISDLLEHRKVLDVLGSSSLIEPTDNQVAGVGFNATVKDEMIVRLSGSFKRVIKLIF